MKRTCIRRQILLPLSCVLLLSISDFALAATESSAVSFSLGVSGNDAALTAQGPSITLTVPNNFNLGSTTGTSAGDSVTSQAAINTGIVNFLGNSTVTGQIGNIVTSQVFASILGGVAGSSVTFNSVIRSVAIDYTAASTMTFNANTSAALHFGNFNGTAIIGPSATYSGAATNTIAGVGVGMLQLNTGSVYTGAIGDATNPLNTITLNGNASINGAFSSKSTVLGANTLTQSGAVTFPSGGSITVRANSDTDFGRINAAGQTISMTSGLLVNMLVEETTILSGTPLQVITGSGPGGATITTSSNNVRFSFTGLNTSGTGNVLITPTVVAAPLPSPGASGAASAFDAAAVGATGDMLYVQQRVTALNNLTAIGQAEAQFAPVVNGSNAFMSFQAVNQFQNMWATNLANARAANMCYHPCACDSLSLSLCNNGCAVQDPTSSQRTGRNRTNSWNGDGFWIDGFAYFADQHERQQIAGYDASMYGIAMGIQQPLSRHWQWGVGIGYAYTDIDGDATVQSNGGHINTTEATAYLGYTKGGFFLDNFLTFAWNDYKGYRDISFPGISRTASYRTDGQAYGAMIATGYNFFYRYGLTVTPLASLEYIRVHIDSYTEVGADSLDLVQQSQNYDQLQSSLGLMVGQAMRFNRGTLFNEIHAKWFYSLDNYQIKNQSRFYGRTAFATTGVIPASNYENIGISSTIFAGRNWAVNLGYDIYLAGNYLAQQGEANIVFRF